MSAACCLQECSKTTGTRYYAFVWTKRSCRRRSRRFLAGAGDAVILPVPAENAHVLLNAPLGSQPCRIEHILDCAGCGAVIIGGKISAQIKTSAAERGQRCFDYMKCPNFTVKNAAITAEGAVSELMRRARAALCDMRILVVGWGRIGKLLINKLSALCPAVYLMSVNTEARALAAELGCHPFRPTVRARSCTALTP